MPTSTQGSRVQTLDEYLTREQVADLLNVTLRTLDRWCAKSNSPRRIKVGGRVLFPVAGLKAFLDEHRDDKRDE